MRIGLRETIFSVNCFAAAMLALFTSFSIGLERPFWAMATVYITSQPLSGTVRSKAVYRLVGTVVGALAAVFLVPTLANMPILLSLTLASWVALCQFVSLLDRTPRAYVFILAGYTVALIGFPSVAHPEAIFDIAVLRVQEIGVGVLCAALVHAVMFPRSVGAMFNGRVSAVVDEAQTWLADVLADRPASRTGWERRRLAADATELHVIATHLPFDTARIRPSRALVSGLQQSLLLLIPLVSAVEDRWRVLAHDATAPAALREAVTAVRDWTMDAALPVAPVTAAIKQARAEVVDSAAWRDMLALNLLARLDETVAVVCRTRTIAAAIADPAHGKVEGVAEVAGRPLHLDHGMAFLSATATFVTLMGCCLFWIMSGWPEGGIAAMIAAVVCCFFGTLDNPVPAQRGFMLWTLASFPLTAAYLFAILPMIDGFAAMTVALAPPLLALGTLMAVPSWYGRMMPMLIGFASGLALTNDFSVDPAGFFNGSVAQLAGVAAAIMTTRLIRSVSADAAIGRLRRAGWRDLATLSDQMRDGDARPLAAWRSRMLDRVGLLAMRSGDAGSEERDAAVATLRELRIGMGIVELGNGPLQKSLRSALADHFRDLAQRKHAPAPPELRDQFDTAIAAARTIVDASDRERQIVNLVGLRRNMLPAAPPPPLDTAVTGLAA